MRASAESVDGKLAALACRRRCSRLPASPPTPRLRLPGAASARAAAQVPVAAAAAQAAGHAGEYPEVSLTAGRSTVLSDRLQHLAHCDHQSGDRRRDGGSSRARF